MDTAKLIATGLTQQQANAYALLIEKGQVSPLEASTLLGLTRSNTYKLLDKLTGMGLAHKKEVAKKFVYTAANPQVLSNLVAKQRDIAVERENAVRDVLADLVTRYRTHTDQPYVETVTGRQAVANAYRKQSNQKQPIYFLRSRLDIAVMGFDTMSEVRTLPARLGQHRYGITPDLGTGKPNADADKRTNLTRTWVRQEDYDAPVEWSISGTTLLIVVFADEPHAITIDSPVVASAFLQIWHLLDGCLRSMTYYNELPR